MPTLTTLTLHPTVTGTWPWTCGHAFKQGDLPAGQTLLGLQTNIRNYWPDGSAKIALVSGSSAVVSGAPLTVTIQTGSAASGTALTEADLAATGVQATLQFGAGPVVSLAPLIGVAAAGASDGVVTGGMVRQLASGPVMSSWLYCAPASSTNVHLMAWFEVRLYAGGAVQVLPWLENGWTRVASKAGHAGTLTFTLGGSTRFTQADVHIAAQCRVVAQDVSGCGYWLGTAPSLSVCPSPTYIQETGLTPSYLVDTSSATTQLNNLTQAYSPTTYGQLTTSPRNSNGNGTNNGEFDPGMGDAGYHAGIGILPEWDAFYLSSGGDVRAYRAVLSNAMGYGRYGVHFRDENTLRPVNPLDVPNKTLPQGSNHNIADIGANQYGAPEILPVVSGYDTGSGVIKPEYWAQTHHPSAGYTAYLLTGHEFFLELCQFVAGTCFLRQNNIARNYGSGYQYTHRETIRGAAWGLRTIFQAATISVDGSTIQTGIATIASNNIQQYYANYITSPCGSFGVPRPYSNFQPSAVPARYNINGWEADFWCATWGYAVDIKPPVSSTRITELGAFFQWTGQWIVGRLGPLNDANSFGYSGAGKIYSTSIANVSTDAPWIGNVGPWMSSWGEAFQLTWGSSNADNSVTNLGGIAGDNGYFPSATSYWGNLQPAIAYAVTHNVPGASAAYARMTGAPNWGDFLASAAVNPVWAVEPRAAAAPPAPPPQSLSVRTDSSPLLAGAVVVGGTGHGVLGSAVPSTGDDGPSLIYPSLGLPYDATVEVRVVVTAMSSGVTAQINEDGSGVVTVPGNGSHWIDTAVYKAGALFGAERHYINVGVAAPILSAATGSAIGSTSASGSVTTDKVGGTLRRVTTTNSTESAATIKAGASQSVTSIGVQSFTASGLLPSTTYRHHLVHVDALGVDSNVISTAPFTTAAAVVAPVFTDQPSSQSVNAPNPVTFTYSISGSGISVQAYRNGLPVSGATLTSYTTGPTSVSGGGHNSGDVYTFTATNAGGSATSSAATLTVNNEAIPISFAGTVPSLQTTVGAAFSFDFAAFFSGNRAPFIYSLASGSLPPGIVFSGSMLIGTASAAQSLSGLSVVAIDADLNVATSNSFSFSVSEAVIPVRQISPLPSFDFREGQHFSYDLSQHFYTTSLPLSYRIEGAPLPRGITLVGSVISGICLDASRHLSSRSVLVVSDAG